MTLPVPSLGTDRNLLSGRSAVQLIGICFLNATQFRENCFCVGFINDDSPVHERLASIVCVAFASSRRFCRTSAACRKLIGICFLAAPRFSYFSIRTLVREYGSTPGQFTATILRERRFDMLHRPDGNATWVSKDVPGEKRDASQMAELCLHDLIDATSPR